MGLQWDLKDPLQARKTLLDFKEYEEENNASHVRKAAEAVYAGQPELVLAALLCQLHTIKESFTMVMLRFMADEPGGGTTLSAKDHYRLIMTIQARAVRCCGWVAAFLTDMTDRRIANVDIIDICTRLCEFNQSVDDFKLVVERLKRFTASVEPIIEPWLLGIADLPTKPMTTPKPKAKPAPSIPPGYVHMTCDEVGDRCGQSGSWASDQAVNGQNIALKIGRKLYWNPNWLNAHKPK